MGIMLLLEPFPSLVVDLEFWQPSVTALRELTVVVPVLLAGEGTGVSRGFWLLVEAGTVFSRAGFMREVAG